MFFVFRIVRMPLASKIDGMLELHLKGGLFLLIKALVFRVIHGGF